MGEEEGKIARGRGRPSPYTDDAPASLHARGRRCRARAERSGARGGGLERSGGRAWI